MGKFSCIFLGILLIALVNGDPDPAELKPDTTTNALKTTANEGWMSTLSSYATWNVLAVGGGVVAVLAILGISFQYFSYATPVTHGPQVAYRYSSPFDYTARALDTGYRQFNFAKVLEYIEIAQKTFERFDWQNLQCQKRMLCEISQKDGLAGETGRQVAQNYLLTFMNALDGVPIPRVIQAFIAEYKGAILQGKNSLKPCGQFYPQCKISIKDVIAEVSPQRRNFY